MNNKCHAICHAYVSTVFPPKLNYYRTIIYFVCRYCTAERDYFIMLYWTILQNRPLLIFLTGDKADSVYDKFGVGLATSC